MKKYIIFLFLTFTVIRIFSLNAYTIDIKPDDYSYILYNIEGDTIVVEHNTDKKFNVASNVKLFTSAYALENLDPGMQFKTWFFLEDNKLCVVPGMDPSLVSDNLLKIAYILKQNDLTKVDTVCYYIPEKYDSLLIHKEPMKSYQASFCPLSFNYNTFKFTVIPGELNEKPEVRVFDGISYFKITNKAKTIKGKRKRLEVEFNNTGTQQEIILSGTIGKDIKFNPVYYRKVYEPVRYFHAALTNKLGIIADLNIITYKDSIDCLFDPVYTHVSKNNLRSMVKMMNIYSSNFIAETLLRHTETSDSVNMIHVPEVWLTDSLHIHNAKIANASGLYHDSNLLSTMDILKLLKYCYRKPELKWDIFSALPIHGSEGTLREKEKLDGVQIRAKTGYLDGKTSLSGLIIHNDKEYLFSIAINYQRSYQVLDVREELLHKLVKKYILGTMK